MGTPWGGNSTVGERRRVAGGMSLGGEQGWGPGLSRRCCLGQFVHSNRCWGWVDAVGARGRYIFSSDCSCFLNETGIQRVRKREGRLMTRIKSSCLEGWEVEGKKMSCDTQGIGATSQSEFREHGSVVFSSHRERRELDVTRAEAWPGD